MSLDVFKMPKSLLKYYRILLPHPVKIFWEKIKKKIGWARGRIILKCFAVVKSLDEHFPNDQPLTLWRGRIECPDPDKNLAEQGYNCR